MALIKNIEGLTTEEINWDLNNGGKFVVYQYTISVIVMTFKRGSAIYFIRAGQSAVKPGIGFTILTFFLGWWGFPWGPIYSIGSMATNFGGGKDVTAEILRVINQSDETMEVLHD